MTNYNSDRLDRIEALVEALYYRIDSNAKAIEANSNAIAEVKSSVNVLAEASCRTLKAVEILREDAEERRQEFEEYKTRTNANLTSLNAAVERLENLFTYLLRRDGENQNQYGQVFQDCLFSHRYIC